MGNQPWLDSLSDDWVSQPGTPPASTTNNDDNNKNNTNNPSHSRRSSLQNSPSRIPVPARRSVEPSLPSPGDKKKVPRPCHFVKKEPPTPKTPRTPKTPSKWRSPVPDKTKKKSPKPTPPSARRKQPVMDTRSPLRSVSNVSSQPGEPSTVQVRPKKNRDQEETPEWRKRLVQGEIPSGEQRDLFAPIGLESVFKPPTPGSEEQQNNAIPKLKHTDDLWGFDDTIQSKSETRPTHDDDDDNDSLPPQQNPQSTKPPRDNNENLASSPPLSPTGTLAIKKGAERAQQNKTELEHSQDDSQMRTASGLEDLRNEGITPITFSRTNTVDGHATSEVIKSALKQVTGKLEKLSLPQYERPDSRASDSILLNQPTDFAIDTLPDDDLFDVTSHSLPQDLSTGTLDYPQHLTREQYLSEASLRRRRLAPPSFPSQHLSPFLPPNARIRSSPPFYNRANPMTDPPSFPRPSPAHARPSTAGQAEEIKRKAMPSSGSPLKLFGNHDTFTNNRLMRRMSQFEETFGGVSEEDEPVSPSEEARRKGESRGHLSAKLDRHDRPRSRNTPNPRLTRFGDGQLDNFDFSDTSPYEPKLLNHDAQDNEVRPSSRRRRYLRRSSHRDFSVESTLSKSNSHLKPKPTLLTSTRLKGSTTGTAGMSSQGSGTNRTSNSPAKDPTPKRRRTVLPSVSSQEGDSGVEAPYGPQNDQLSLLQKSLMQQGVEYNKDLLLPPESTHRPRTPTPSQIRSSTRQRSPPNRNLLLREFYGEGEDSLPDANVPKVRVTGANEEIRKGSITTQDFLNEATKIMDIIRSKGRKTGSLPNVEEYESESEGKSENDYEDESTQEEFSRPPSRDGVDIRKLREPKEPNPRILSHLKKFQEQDDLELSVNLPAEGIVADRRKRKQPTQSFDDDNDFLNTHISSKSFSTRSIPTGSSHSSHKKGLLPSDLVSHLIPEEVNGFTYDRYRNLWVREKPRRSPEKPKGDDSEDDPFQDIPDLSVDEIQEMMRIQASLSGDAGHSVDIVPQSPANVAPQDERTQPHMKAEDQSGNFSSVQSKATRFTSSFPNSGTGATSVDSNGGRSREASSEASHEIHLQEGRLSRPPSLRKERNKQARVVTISFSSPLVSQVTYSDHESPVKLQKNEKADPEPEAETNEQASAGSSQNQTVEQPFLKRSMSRIDETSEETADNLMLVRRNAENPWSTPGKEGSDGSLAVLRDAPDPSYNSFHLSPLPDFTVDQIDQPLQLEMSYVAQRTHPTSLRQVHGTFALATEDLVKHITEAEPFEPYWEHVRRLVLRRKGLITLHKLSDFCPRLEYLDVSFNEIGQLSGAPSTLRTLKIQQNYLSNLTSWGHLGNLQYLDVSGNGLESLDGFSGLIHLRELNASNNKIRDIEGLYDLDGLLSLKLSNNNMTAVDFEGAELTRLQELDLSHNQLMSVRSIESLSALERLDLSSNHLSNVDLTSPLTTLRSLKLSNNQFYNLDVGVFPSLTLLYLDQNYLSTISGLGQCRNLEVLSAREQTMSAENDNGFFDIDLGLAKDVRKVYLSSNRLSLQSLSPSNPLLSLQLLDAASCSIQALPPDFALNFPNVKVLNLNFNSLTGISELAGMNCLSRLTAAGNCISRLRRLCQVLSVIGRTNKNKLCSLHKVDVRGNPLTVRFYPPAVTGNGKPGDAKQLATRVEKKPVPQEDGGLDIPSALAEFKREDHDINRPIFEDEQSDVVDGHEIEINDPYTLPPADSQADLKYLARLDRPTRLRRSIFELMLYAGTGGSVKFLDGLDLRPVLEEGSDMDRAWMKLEKLGVLKKKAITA
ncbi:hypothetical protein BDV59DRAFT_166258 [Aspergillus ambiguus]|uniref:uncharacterized protein n=1 Tax=Aspergillus ambiguus TaxID=176160 RepID=UPI003CCD8A1B